MSNAQRAQTFLQHIDEATERLLSRQLTLVRLAAESEKDTPTTAVETAEIEASATSIVRAVEDLLVVTRGLKEAWTLGQIRQPLPEIPQAEIERRKTALREVLDVISDQS